MKNITQLIILCLLLSTANVAWSKQNNPSTTGCKKIQGTVKFYKESEGHGFIDPINLGRDIFVHHSSIVGGRGLSDGQKVEFCITQGPKGEYATQVTHLSH
jgi:CspA family cold shock protein